MCTHVYRRVGRLKLILILPIKCQEKRKEEKKVNGWESFLEDANELLAELNFCGVPLLISPSDRRSAQARAMNYLQKLSAGDALLALPIF